MHVACICISRYISDSPYVELKYMAPDSIQRPLFGRKQGSWERDLGCGPGGLCITGLSLWIAELSHSPLLTCDCPMGDLV